MEDRLIDIPEENIYMEFSLDNQMYAVISKSVDLSEDDDIYLVKEDLLDDMKIIRNIETEEEYKRALEEYERILERLGDEEEDDE